MPFSNYGPGYEYFYNDLALFYDTSTNQLGADISGNCATASELFIRNPPDTSGNYYIPFAHDSSGNQKFYTDNFFL